MVAATSGGTGIWWSGLAPARPRRRRPRPPCDDDTATLQDYADPVVEAIGERRDVVVVAQSYGGFTAPLVADRVPVDVVVFVTAMVPAPGPNLPTGGITSAIATPLRNRLAKMAA